MIVARRSSRTTLKDLSAVKSAMAGCDTVFHLAANPDIAKPVTQPDIDLCEGTYLTQILLDQLRVYNAWLTRIYRTLSPLLPRALHRASFTVNIGADARFCAAADGGSRGHIERQVGTANFRCVKLSVLFGQLRKVKLFT